MGMRGYLSVGSPGLESACRASEPALAAFAEAGVRVLLSTGLAIEDRCALIRMRVMTGCDSASRQAGCRIGSTSL